MVRQRVLAGALAVVTLLLGVPVAGATPTATDRARALLPPNDPPASIPKNPAFAASCRFRTIDASPACQVATLQAIANARAQEGLRPLVPPTNYSQLTAAQQLFTLLDIERVDRGLAPIGGLVDSLSNAALLGALGLGDPQLPSGYPYTRYGTIFAGGESSPLGSLYDWLYFDGPGGNSSNCPSAGAAGCWIHRNVILGSYDANPSSMGTSAVLGSYQGLPLPLYGGLIVGDRSGVAPAYSFSWAQELPYLSPPPAVRAFTPTSGPAAGGTTVTITGSNLKGVTSLVFGAAGSATNLRPSADGSSLTAASPPGAPGRVVVTMGHAGGASDIATFTYERSVPSAPRAVGATVPAPGRATASWAAPASNGGAAITGYTVIPLLGGRAAGPAHLLAATATSAPFIGLVDGQTYTFTVTATNAIGVGRAALSPMVLPPFATLAAFVQRQHQDIVGAPVPDVELLVEVDALAKGVSPAAYPAGLRRSTDATGHVDPVARLYYATFLRIPDAAGLTYWIGRARAGTGLDQVASSFSASAEFGHRYGALSDPAFVGLVYQNVLGRPGDAAGIAYWSKQLATKASTRGTVILGFSESTEYRTKKAAAVDVAVTWIDLLAASPDQATFDRWVADLTSGASSEPNLVAALLADPRYATRVG